MLLLLTGKHLCWSPFLILNIPEFFRPLILKNICKRLLLKMCLSKLFIKRFKFTFKKTVFSTSVTETRENICFYFMIGFPWSLFIIHIQYFFSIVRNYSKHLIPTRVNQANVMWTCFKFWPMKNIFCKLQANESLIMASLQIYRELLSLATFLRVHSNSNEVSYLSWQNMYPNLKTTSHIKIKFFLWTKLL